MNIPKTHVALACAALAETAFAVPLTAALKGDWTSDYSSAGLSALVEYDKPQPGRFADASGILRSLHLNADGPYVRQRPADGHHLRRHE